MLAEVRKGIYAGAEMTQVCAARGRTTIALRFSKTNALRLVRPVQRGIVPKANGCKGNDGSVVMSDTVKSVPLIRRWVSIPVAIHRAQCGEGRSVS